MNHTWIDLSEFKKEPSKNKSFLSLFIVIFLLVLIPVGIYLVRQTQVFKPKAVDEQISRETSFTLIGNADTANLAVGQQFSADLLVRSDFDPVASFSAELNFPKDLIEVVGIEAPIISADFCGGIAGIECPQGYSCQLSEPQNQPDQAGVCVADASVCTEDTDCSSGYFCNRSPGCTDITSNCTQMAEGVCQVVQCAQIVTRACSPTDPQVCRDFPTPCDVPQGWVVVQSSSPEFFINQWITRDFSNNTGVISLAGKTTTGVKTSIGRGLTMARITFKAKASGSGTISIGDAQILRVSDNQNVLQTKRNLDFTVLGATNSCTSNSQCTEEKYCQLVRRECPDGQSCTAVLSGYCINNNGGKGDGNNDGFIDLVDLSILYSNFLKQRTDLNFNDGLDFNNDGKINSFDYLYMISLLKSLQVIR